MSNPTRITLSWPEIEYAAYVGIRRRVSALATGRNSTAANDGWEPDIGGALGECALAKYLDRFWSGTIGKINTADVGRYQVRHSLQSNRRLIIRKNDDDGAIFVFITGEPPHFWPRGWMWCRDGKRPEFWCDPNGTGFAYFVPASALRPMEELPEPDAVDIPF